MDFMNNGIGMFIELTEPVLLLVLLIYSIFLSFCVNHLSKKIFLLSKKIRILTTYFRKETHIE